MQTIEQAVVGAGIESSVIHADSGVHVAARGHFPFFGAGCSVNSVDSIIPRSEIDHVIQCGDGNRRADGAPGLKVICVAGSIRLVVAVQPAGICSENQLIAPDAGMRKTAGTLSLCQIPLHDLTPEGVIHVGDCPGANTCILPVSARKDSARKELINDAVLHSGAVPAV